MLLALSSIIFFVSGRLRSRSRPEQHRHRSRRLYLQLMSSARETGPSKSLQSTTSQRDIMLHDRAHFFFCTISILWKHNPPAGEGTLVKW